MPSGLEVIDHVVATFAVRHSLLSLIISYMSLLSNKKKTQHIYVYMSVNNKFMGKSTFATHFNV